MEKNRSARHEVAPVYPMYVDNPYCALSTNGLEDSKITSGQLFAQLNALHLILPFLSFG